MTHIKLGESSKRPISQMRKQRHKIKSFAQSLLCGFRGLLPTPTPIHAALKTSQQLEFGDRPPHTPPPKERIMKKNNLQKKKTLQLVLSLFWEKGSWHPPISEVVLLPEFTFTKGWPCATLRKRTSDDPGRPLREAEPRAEHCRNAQQAGGGAEICTQFLG